MKSIDYNYLCTVIGNLAGIPIRLFKNEKQIFYHSLVNLPKDPLIAFKNEVFRIDSHVGYFITPSFNYYGIVNAKPYRIVVGPTRYTNGKDQDIKELGFRCDVAPDEMNDFVIAMKSIVHMPLESIMQMLCAINYILNKEKLSLSDIIIYDSEQQTLKQLIESERANNNLNADIQNNQELQNVHNTFAIEQTIMNIVRKGDTGLLKDWITSAPAVRGGILAADQLRHIKNTFIVTTTLASRSAIRGGMDVDDALSLSDSYIQKVELMNSVDRITNLQFHMVLDYTERVEKLRLGKTPSKLILEVTNYIQHHLSERISTEEMANSLFLSRSRLAVKFKQESGMTLTDFILREKTEEAKRLLRYTDKTAVAISSYLGFSSQSHFSRVFKKYTGKSPNEYREHHNT
ncbi:MAG: helix-turn-helix domain-containing protein [Acholeplasmataceae bacterium]|nr:helix-turn-helix domain-containing protein [Acholeplasmataceae bacterium]